VPAGAPVIVSCAADGVADTAAQTAAVDRNVKIKRFILIVSNADPGTIEIAL
jgi:hypothetical protein